MRMDQLNMSKLSRLYMQHIFLLYPNCFTSHLYFTGTCNVKPSSVGHKRDVLTPGSRCCHSAPAYGQANRMVTPCPWLLQEMGAVISEVGAWFTRLPEMFIQRWLKHVVKPAVRLPGGGEGCSHRQSLMEMWSMGTAAVSQGVEAARGVPAGATMLCPGSSAPAGYMAASFMVWLGRQSSCHFMLNKSCVLQNSHPWEKEVLFPLQDAPAQALILVE